MLLVIYCLVAGTQVVYMKNNLEKFAKKAKLSTPLTIKPLSFEVSSTVTVDSKGREVGS